MKKMIVLMLCAAMLLTAVACGAKESPKTEPAQTEMQQQESRQAGTGTLTEGDVESVQIPDPFTVYDSLEECVLGAGLDLTVPESVNNSAERMFRAIKGEMAEVIYLDASGEEICRIRKAAGNDDISGDYNEYAESSVMTADEVIVNYRGENDLVKVANWSIGEDTFSLTAGIGMDTEAVAEIVKGIK